MKLIQLGFTKLAKEETIIPRSTNPLLTLPKTTSKIKISDPNTYSGKNIVKDNLNNYSSAMQPKPLHPITKKVLSSISKDVQSYASGNKEVWDNKYKKFEKAIKDPKKVLGAGAGLGLYFYGKKHPKVENAINVIKDRQFNIINKPNQRLSFSVPKNKKGNWNLSWSKSF